jgi:hypothetical protein
MRSQLTCPGCFSIERTPISLKVGVVYGLVYEGDLSAVKIGHTSKTVAERIEGMSTAHYLDLICIAVMAGSQQDERALHTQFASHRIKKNREWFRLEGAVLEWCRANRTTQSNTKPTPILRGDRPHWFLSSGPIARW